MVLKNKDVRKWLETRSLMGPMPKHPQYDKMPMKGVYMFDRLGTASLVDFSYLEKWDLNTGEFELDMRNVFFQTGMPPVKRTPQLQ